MMTSVALLGKTPISEESPAGQDVRYDECFEALQEEIDKLSSPTARDTFQWDTVAALSTGILTENSKDLLVASYLCVALVNLEGMKGLESATAIYSDLLATYWEHLYPPIRRMGGRLSAVRWWMEKTEEALSTEMAGATSEEESRRIIENLGQIDRFFQEKTEFDLVFGPLTKKIESKFPTQPETREKPTAPIEMKAGEGASLALGDVALDAGNLMRSMAPLFKNIKLASRMVREEARHNPQSYRWLRFAAWDPVKELPPAVGGLTKIPPPPQQASAHLKSLKDDESWEELLSQSEAHLYNPQHTFLLSLNYYTAEALSHLGKKYAVAHEMVCRETQLLLRRLPGIEALSFSDGTPFACEETLEWISRMTHPQDGEGEEEGGARLSPDEASVNDVINQARALAREDGKLHAAVEGLHRKINGSVSGEEALRLRLGLIRVLAENKSEKVAVAHMEKVYGDIIRFDLVRWDPPLALSGLKVIYHVMKRLPGKGHAARSAEILTMIAEINTVDAMKLQKKR